MGKEQARCLDVDCVQNMKIVYRLQEGRNLFNQHCTIFKMSSQQEEEQTHLNSIELISKYYNSKHYFENLF